MDTQSTHHQASLTEPLADLDSHEVPTAKLTDLPLNESSETQVKGGMLLPAVQKVREAAARAQASGGLSAGKVSYSDLS